MTSRENMPYVNVVRMTPKQQTALDAISFFGEAGLSAALLGWLLFDVRGRVSLEKIAAVDFRARQYNSYQTTRAKGVIATLVRRDLVVTFRDDYGWFAVRAKNKSVYEP